MVLWPEPILILVLAQALGPVVLHNAGVRLDLTREQLEFSPLGMPAYRSSQLVRRNIPTGHLVCFTVVTFLPIKKEERGSKLGFGSARRLQYQSSLYLKTITRPCRRYSRF